MLDAAYIQQSLARLYEARAAVFGSDSHRFLLNDIVTESEATAFESQHGIHLPHEYRHFLTAIGNGGAGPFYGVFPLGMMDRAFGFQPWREGDGFVGKLVEPFPLKAEWNDLTGMPMESSFGLDDPAFDEQVERFDELYWDSSRVNGAIPICHTGCALRIWLVVTGDRSGNLWYDRRAEYSGLAPITNEDGAPISFSGWYESWLKLALREVQTDI